MFSLVVLAVSLLLPTAIDASARNVARADFDDIGAIDTSVLDPYIPDLNGWFTSGDWSGWTVIDNTHQSADETCACVLQSMSANPSA